MKPFLIWWDRQTKNEKQWVQNKAVAGDIVTILISLKNLETNSTFQGLTKQLAKEQSLECI